LRFGRRSKPKASTVVYDLFGEQDSKELDRKKQPPRRRRTKSRTPPVIDDTPVNEEGSEEPRVAVQVQISSIMTSLTGINKKKASEMAGVDGENDHHHHRLHFTCPASSCSMMFDDSWTYGDFVRHISSHELELFSMGINICPLGCCCGFSDAIQQRAHLLSGCSRISPPVVPSAVGSLVCGYRDCSQRYDDLVSLRLHFQKKHANRVYDDPRTTYKDHVCQLGFLDAGSLHHHMTAKSNKGGHVCTLLKNLDVARWIAHQYTPIESGIHPIESDFHPIESDFHPMSDIHPIESDIIRSVDSYPAPTTFYDLDLLDKQLLSVDDLVLLWEQNIAGIRMTVQYPESTARQEIIRVAGSVRSAGILAWKIPAFTPGMTEGNPKTLLSPSLSDPQPTDNVCHQPPPTSTLKEMYNSTIKQNKVHLIFVYRHSGEATEDHEHEHIHDAIKTASDDHASGIANVVSISAVCGRNVKGPFSPSFSHDLETELELICQSVECTRRSTQQLKAFLFEGDRAAEPSTRIKAQIIRAVMEGCRPVVVSIGTNAMSHDWCRLSLFLQEYGPQYTAQHLTRRGQWLSARYKQDFMFSINQGNEDGVIPSEGYG
jgi:hypothetical protein